MKKQIIDFRIIDRKMLAGDRYALLKLVVADGPQLPEGIRAGQFAQVDAGCKGVMLRRPISINKIDYATGELWLLVRDAGRGTHAITRLSEGDMLNMVLPLGNTFSYPAAGSKVLLVGGGVGVAPTLQLGRELKAMGTDPVFLLGARSQTDLLELDEFSRTGKVHVTTEDGSMGVRGFVTDHPAMNERYDMVYCCGPAPMMKSVARSARKSGSACEVSLENMMACGLGACLCCVEKTVKGNVCVCTEGPVFNIDQLTWN